MMTQGHATDALQAVHLKNSSRAKIVWSGEMLFHPAAESQGSNGGSRISLVWSTDGQNESNQVRTRNSEIRNCNGNW